MEAVNHITRRMRRLPLSVKMLIVSIVLVLMITPLLIAGFLSQQASRNNLLQGKREELRLDAEAIASAIDYQIANRKLEAQAVGENQAVVDFVAAGAADATTAASVQEDLRALTSVRVDVFAIFLVDSTTNKVILSTTSDVEPTVATREFVKAATTGQTSMSAPSRDRDLIYYATPVSIDEAASPIVAVTAVSARDIWRTLLQENGQLARGWSAVITDDNGVRIGHSSTRGLLYSSWVPLAPDNVETLIAEQTYGSDIRGLGSSEEVAIAASLDDPVTPGNIISDKTDESGEVLEVGLARLKEADWYVVESIPRSSFLAGADSMRFWMILIIGFTILTITLLTFMIGRMALKPLRQLLSSVESMSNGDLDTPVPMIQGREMNALGHQFDNMRLKVMESFHELQQGDTLTWPRLWWPASRRETLIRPDTPKGSSTTVRRWPSIWG